MGKNMLLVWSAGKQMLKQVRSPGSFLGATPMEWKITDRAEGIWEVDLTQFQYGEVRGPSEEPCLGRNWPDPTVICSAIAGLPKETENQGRSSTTRGACQLMTTCSSMSTYRNPGGTPAKQPPTGACNGLTPTPEEGLFP